MADLTAQETLHDIGLVALISLMAHLVALEAKFGVTVEGVMSVLTTQNAIWTAPLIGALLRHMSKLLAIPALYRRVELDVVAGHLVFHLGEHVVFLAVFIVPCLLHRVENLAILLVHLLLIFVWVDVPAEIHITFDGAARDD